VKRDMPLVYDYRKHKVIRKRGKRKTDKEKGKQLKLGEKP
jgi:hypothetical protein